MSCSCCDPFGHTDSSDFESDFEHEEISLVDSKFQKIYKFINYLKANDINIDKEDKIYIETYNVFFSKEDYQVDEQHVINIEKLIIPEKKIETEKLIKEYIETNLI